MAGQRQKKRTVAGITIIVLLVIVGHYTGILSPLESILQKLLMPGSKTLYKMSVYKNEQTETFESVKALKTAYEKLIVDNTECSVIKNENAELREQLNFLQKKSYKTLGAETIGKNIEPLGNTIIINRGVQDGIRIGQPVIVQNGILVGKIMRVEKQMSIVLLINDNRSAITAAFGSVNHNSGVVEGGHGISIRLNFIPQHESIQINDSIITAGLEESIPRGLVIGTVDAVEKQAYEPFQSAILTPAADLNNITLVSVILEKTQ